MPGKRTTAKLVAPTQPPGAFRLPPGYTSSLSKSDRQFLIAYAQSRTIREAGILWAQMRGVVDRSENTLRCDAYKKLREIREKVAAAGNPDEFWEFLGLGANRIATALSEGLGATHITPMMAKRAKVMRLTNSKGEEYEKIVDEQEPVLVEHGPDYQVRVNAAMAAARLRGDLANAQPSSASESEGGPPRITITITQYNTQINNSGGNGKCLPVN